MLTGLYYKPCIRALNSLQFIPQHESSLVPFYDNFSWNVQQFATIWEYSQSIRNIRDEMQTSNWE